MTIGDLDCRYISTRTTWLHNCRDARGCSGSDPFCKREVRITRHHGSAGAFAGLAQRNINGNAAIHLRSADAERCGAARNHDRI
jgi:hypothetical protein